MCITHDQLAWKVCEKYTAALTIRIKNNLPVSVPLLSARMCSEGYFVCRLLAILHACAHFHPRMRFILQYVLSLSVTLNCVYGHTVYTHHTHPVQGHGTMGVHLDAWKCTGQ